MRKNRKSLLFEALLILILSLVLSFIYNTVSPTGIELLPERVLKKKTEFRTILTATESANNALSYENNIRAKAGIS